MTYGSSFAATVAAFALVSKQSGIEYDPSESAACERAINVYASEGATYSVRLSPMNPDAAIITYHHSGCVNDGFETFVFINDIDVITWEN